MIDRLANEFLDAINKRGQLLKRMRILEKWLKLIEPLHIIDGNR